MIRLRTAMLVVALGLGLAPRSSAEPARDRILNCNDVDPSERCACNRRVLQALNELRTIIIDPVNFGDTSEANAHILIRYERVQRLKSFIAPDCENPSSPGRLPLSDQHRAPLPLINIRLQPPATRPISNLDPDVTPTQLLRGRWDGWLTVAGGRPSHLFLQVVGVDADSFVLACSDQGMVFGTLRGGFLEWQIALSPGLTHSIRVWRSGPPHYRDLEGVALLDQRPGEEIVAGLVWLKREPKRAASFMPTGYPCRDLELEDKRERLGPPELKRALPIPCPLCTP